MRLIRHPLVNRDLVALVDHIVETTSGDFDAASRRLDEIDTLLADILANPLSGMRLAPPLDGWLVRQGGRGQRITIVFKPDWTRHAKAAPFKRNDAMLDVLPVGVLVFPGNGIQENLADKAKKLGIPVMKFEKGA